MYNTTHLLSSYCVDGLTFVQMSNESRNKCTVEREREGGRERERGGGGEGEGEREREGEGERERGGLVKDASQHTVS